VPVLYLGCARSAEPRSVAFGDVSFTPTVTVLTTKHCKWGSLLEYETPRRCEIHLPCSWIRPIQHDTAASSYFRIGKSNDNRAYATRQASLNDVYLCVRKRDPNFGSVMKYLQLSGSQPASCQVGTGNFSMEVKRPRRGALLTTLLRTYSWRGA